MSGKRIRIDLDAVSDPGRSDWSRLRALTDAEIDAAIANDPDSFAMDDAVLTGRHGASYRYMIYRDPKGGFRWKLLANGEVLANGARAFDTFEAGEQAIALVRDALLGARSEAA